MMADVETYVGFPEEQVAYPEMVKFMYFVLRMPATGIRETLIDMVGEQNIDDIDDWIQEALSEKKVTANFPSHPDNVVIESEYYPEGIDEKAVWKYYDSVKEDMVQALEGADVILVLQGDGAVYKRHADDEFVSIGDLADFEKYNNGRVVEFHRVISNPSDYGYIDIDPNEEVPFAKTKKVAGDLYKVLKANPEVAEVAISFSGGRGFHLYPRYKRPKPVDQLREELKEVADSYIESMGDEKLSTSIVRGKDEMRLDTSTLKDKGSLRVPGSLNTVTGLICTPITINALDRFDPKDAKLPKEVFKESSLYASVPEEMDVFEYAEIEL